MTNDFKQLYYEQEGFWREDLNLFPEEQQRLRETGLAIPADVESILDVGCGNGSFLNSLPDHFTKMGLDFSREALRHVQCETTLGDCHSLPFEDLSYDLVTCLEVLEHITFDKLPFVVSEIARVASKHILLTVPNEENLERNLVICPKCHCSFSPCCHVRSFSHDSFPNLFPGFTLQTVKGIGPVQKRTWLPENASRIVSAIRVTAMSPSAICPQCHYQRPAGGKTASDETRQATTRGILRGLLEDTAKAVRYTLPHTKVHKWMLALYTRSTPTDAFSN